MIKGELGMKKEIKVIAEKRVTEMLRSWKEKYKW
jgi:hypothetical protein